MEEFDEEAAAPPWLALEKLEKLPTYRRARTAILDDGRDINVAKLDAALREEIVEKALQESNEKLFSKLRDRIDKVGLELPSVEMRFEHLNVDADVYVGSRALPTLLNYSLNTLEELVSIFRVSTRKQTLNILRDVSGIVKPRRLTLLLGPPSSGKTTLLKALGGRLENDLKVTGKLSFNGHGLDEFVPRRTAAYIDQTDLHIGEMTVRETISFSGRCQGVGNRHDVLLELCRREKVAGIRPDPDIDAFMKASAVEGQETSIVTDYVLKILGLDICADTLVGDQMRRGISGGQKKRLTTAEMLVGPANVLLMDEISTGLDSSTTYRIVKHLKQVVRFMDSTIVVSLLQPAPEVYELFDDLILLSDGYIIYQGPRELVLDFFQTLGFKCPERKGVADFLQEITSRKDQEQYWALDSQPYSFVSEKDFSEAFHKFHVGQTQDEELNVPYDKSKSHPAALVKTTYGLSNWQLFRACFAREWLLMNRNSFLYLFKTAQIAFMATACMTMFLRTEHHINVQDGVTLVGALYYALVMLMFNGMVELSTTIYRLPVFFKQRFLFYPAWAFSLPTWVTRVPFSLLEVAIWELMTYWTIGYAPRFTSFLKQLALLFVLHNMSMGLFRFLASVARSIVVANTLGSLSLIVLFVLGGFIISKDQIHPWWIWGYWMSPLGYAQNAISVNEFLSPRWQVITGNSTEAAGVTVLKSRGIPPQVSLYWIAIVALLGYTLFFNTAFTLAISFLNPLGKPQAVLSDEHAHKKKPKQELPIVDGAVKKGMVLPFQPLSMAFHDVSYFIDMPKMMRQKGDATDKLQLLRDITGAFRPGVLTALVGVSGAGKTTLMDVLAGRKTSGYIQGSISINGYPKKQETFARIAGYCEQNDIHSPHVTVEESLIYSAWLRLPPQVDKQTRMMFVEEVLELVELATLRTALVGVPGMSGLSGEQRKRLTVAVELVANPSIIFMDEPTSGLDARAAAIVMRTVRNTVDTGRTVVCTIHQPSIDIFESFDELLLMKRGGQLIYGGPLGVNSHDLISYFEAFEGVPPISSGANPATWMLEVTTQEMEAKLQVDFADVYRKSPLFRRIEDMVTDLSKPAAGSADLSFSTKYSQGLLEQFKACLWKQYWSYWRNPHYNLVRFVFTFVCALMFGTIFWGRGSEVGTQQQVFNLMGSMYAAVLFVGVNNATTIQPVIGTGKPVFNRERAAGMYSAFPFAFSHVAIEIPYVLLQSILYLSIVFPMIGYEWSASNFFYFLFFMYFTFLYFTYYGMMIISVAPNFEVAAVASLALFGVWNLFSGFLIPRPKIPVWWQWFYWCDPVAWSLNGLVTSQLGHRHGDVDVPGRGSEAIKVFLDRQFGFRSSFLPVTVGMQVLMVVLFATVFALSVRYINHLKR